MHPSRAYALAVATRAKAEQSGARTDVIANLRHEERQLAYAVAARLGHIPTRQYNTVECARCGRSGSVGERLAGAIHKEQCQ